MTSTDVLRDVSIHAPLARSNKSSLDITRFSFLFQYMLLLRGATFLRIY